MYQSTSKDHLVSLLTGRVEWLTGVTMGYRKSVITASYYCFVFMSHRDLRRKRVRPAGVPHTCNTRAPNSELAKARNHSFVFPDNTPVVASNHHGCAWEFFQGAITGTAERPLKLSEIRT